MLAYDVLRCIAQSYGAQPKTQHAMSGGKNPLKHVPSLQKPRSAKTSQSSRESRGRATLEQTLSRPSPIDFGIFVVLCCVGLDRAERDEKCYVTYSMNSINSFALLRTSSKFSRRASHDFTQFWKF
mmetsp:Transcript_10056/g.19865  ORF Transcript_10056/g.19865 Transcript_10056/m.19865 type:complete len:126 (-) Transcript_10056:2095-2472(-)